MSVSKNTVIPSHFKVYFWDIKFDQLNIQKHAHLIIKRVLDRGDMQDARWIYKTYGEDLIKNTILSTKDLARPTANFWADILDLDKTKVPCLQQPYSPIHFGLSS